MERTITILETLSRFLVPLIAYVILVGPVASAFVLIRHVYWKPLSKEALGLSYYFGLLSLAFLWTSLAAGLAMRTGWRALAFLPMLLMIGLAASYFRGTRNSPFRVVKAWELTLMLSISYLMLGGIGLENDFSFWR